MVFQNDILAGSSGASGTSTAVHTIDQSIRFNQADNASMSRTPSSASSRTTWTFSWWWKRGNLSGSTNGTNQRQPIFGTTAFSILSNHNNTQIDGINVVFTGAANDVQTSEKFRDTLAWYNFQAVLDTTNDVASERFRLYKNGQRITDFASITYPAKDTEYTINNTQAHYIGFRNSGENLDGYLADIVFIDGQALDPSSFGLYNDSKIWIPKDVSGLTFGTNGFHIKGESASDLGNDSSSNNNDFTTSGLASHDFCLDSPTNNFAVLNPLDVYSTSPSNGNLKYAGSNGKARASVGIPKSGKWYWEVRADASRFYAGLISLTNVFSSSLVITSNAGSGYYTLERQSTNNYFYNASTSSTSLGSQTLSSGDVMAFAYDSDTRKLWIGYDGGSGSVAWYSSGDPASGSNELATLADDEYSVFVFDNSSLYSTSLNFGQEGTFGGTETASGNSDANGIGNFFYSVPSGFKALCTKNLGS